MPMYNNLKLKSRRRQLRYNLTDAERLLWSKLRNRQIRGVKFFRQYSVGYCILDFYAPSHRLAIEVDGGQHAERVQLSSDQYRTKYLRQLQIAVIRFWNNDVLTDISGVVEQIEHVLSVTPPNLPLP